MSLDGVIDAPTWTFDHGFDPHMGEAIAAVTARPRGSRLAVGTEKPRKCVPGSLQTVSGGSVDDVAVGDRLVVGAEPKQRLEAGHRRAAAVVAKDELIQVDGQVLG